LIALWIISSAVRATMDALSAIAFLFGAQVDALVREETEGDPSGRSPRRRKLSR
jgi:hypothetical protein